MNCFTPKRFPSLTVYYDGWLGQEATFDDPGSEDVVEFHKIEVEGNRLDIDLEDHLIETFENEWEIEIKELRYDR